MAFECVVKRTDQTPEMQAWLVNTQPGIHGDMQVYPCHWGKEMYQVLVPNDWKRTIISLTQLLDKPGCPFAPEDASAWMFTSPYKQTILFYYVPSQGKVWMEDEHCQTLQQQVPQSIPVRHGFSIYLCQWRQLSQIQEWLMQLLAGEMPENGVSATIAEYADSVIKLIFFTEPRMEVLPVEARLYKTILIHRFKWAETLADDFIAQGSHIRCLLFPNGVKMYYCQPLDADMAMILFDTQH